LSGEQMTIRSTRASSAQRAAALAKPVPAPKPAEPIRK
jgi:hypothetical protein